MLVTLPEVVSDDEVGVYLDRLAQLRDRRQDYAIILDGSLSSGFSARQRQMQADYVAEGISITREHLKAFAFVAKSTMQRGMLTAILWLQRPVWPNAVFASLAEADAFCRSHLKGIPPR